MNSRIFFTELKRRRIYGVAAAYVVGAWLLIQVATQVFPFFDIPNWIVRLVVLLSIVGFPIAVVCAWAFEVTPQTTGKRGRKLTALIVILAAGAVGVTVFRFLPTGFESGEKPPAAIENELDSIAVLPFENQSADESNAYFVSGMRDEILTGLAQLRDLNVRSRTSTRRYEKTPETWSRSVASCGSRTFSKAACRRRAKTSSSICN